MIQWAVVGVYVGAMFLLASQEASSASYTRHILAKWFPHLTNAEMRQMVLLMRKSGHVLAYGVLTLVVYLAARKTKKVRRFALPLAALCASLTAVADESYQSYLHYRTGAVQDVLIDGIGIGAMVLVLWLVARRRSRQNEEVAEENVEN